jgi:hypothetical protein
MNHIRRNLMEGLYDVVFTFCDKVVLKIDGVSSFANAISILESIQIKYAYILESLHLSYEIGAIYGYDQKGLRYIVHKRELHFSSGMENVA